MDAYDPLSYENLAQSVVNAMMARDRDRMPPSSSFEGPGVYALNVTAVSYNSTFCFAFPALTDDLMMLLPVRFLRTQ